ncbi:Atrial natriuretic peptide receptor 1 [Acropora cervicornis]|uniref:Atrial natriuretic peptide receptor 1 n=1 Tax=Acropora cervicornis TaxID=6130 RepID=A0AAD9VEW7_ACRCE|nr:Atrial natriuretic peptide receptor 1 [Acropora cervicornis]
MAENGTADFADLGIVDFRWKRPSGSHRFLNLFGCKAGQNFYHLFGLRYCKDIIKRVVYVEVPVFRPLVPNFIPDLVELKDLMKICWEEDPDNRPDFSEIKKRIHKTVVTKGMKTNIFDSMIYMMENYADNLEDLVTERTGQLIEAKRETEELLYKILPRSVAEQLKKGKSVEAENFDEVSIYFSDIVGFTQLSSESSPMQALLSLV